MAESLASGEARADAAGGSPAVDWEAIERSPEFQELVSRRRRFVVPATLFFLAWYMGFIVLTAYAPDFMAKRVYEGLTVGYCLALTQFLMVLGLGIAYLRRASRVYDPLAEAVVDRAGQSDGAPERRFAREGLGARAASATTTEEAPR
jgi:uncharacterized membrane protein (DUF485 family)